MENIAKVPNGMEEKASEAFSASAARLQSGKGQLKD